MSTVQPTPRNQIECDRVVNGTTWTKVCSAKFFSEVNITNNKIFNGDPYTFFKQSDDLMVLFQLESIEECDLLEIIEINNMNCLKSDGAFLKNIEIGGSLMACLPFRSAFDTLERLFGHCRNSSMSLGNQERDFLSEDEEGIFVLYYANGEEREFSMKMKTNEPNWEWIERGLESAGSLFTSDLIILVLSGLLLILLMSRWI